MVLAEATMCRVSTQVLIKFEQGHKQLAFVQHSVLRPRTVQGLYLSKEFLYSPPCGPDVAASSPRLGLIKSYWFKTFSHATFTDVWNLLYGKGKKKTLSSGIITKYITALGLASIIMCDGSLSSSNQMILHMQSYTKKENEMMSKELNAKFGLRAPIVYDWVCHVISHKQKYWVINIPARDAARLRELIQLHMLPSFAYKIPR